MLKRTALFSAHQNLGARLVDFCGWEMPVLYTSITEEHLAVRNAAGVFDISHMGEVTVSGAGAAEFLNRVLVNDIRKLAPGHGQYTLMCNERGGAIDDLYAYQLADGVYFLVINASRIYADVAWLQVQAAKFRGDDASSPDAPAQEASQSRELILNDASHHYSAVAVQGPRVKDFINTVVPGASISARRVNAVTDLKKNEVGGFPFEHGGVLVSRTGYTGEDGFEILGGNEEILRVWGAILEAGRPFGVKPCGLGARDTLRTEVCYPLYGHELDEDTTPIEAGLGRFVSFDKDDFIGKPALALQNAAGVHKKLMAFKMTGISPSPRPQCAIFSGGDKVGVVTSGTPSPSLGVGIGMGYVTPECATHGRILQIEIRKRLEPAVVVQKPIYHR
jgi:aminomethyltransferase